MAALILTSRIAKTVWQLTDPFENRAYVVAGRERALLADTMAGFGDVVGLAGELAGGVPVTVALTHRHCDHVGGAFGAGEVLMHAADDVEDAKLFIEWPFSTDDNLHDLADIDKNTTLLLALPTVSGIELDFDTSQLVEEDLTKFGSAREATLAKRDKATSGKEVVSSK